MKYQSAKRLVAREAFLDRKQDVELERGILRNIAQHSGNRELFTVIHGDASAECVFPIVAEDLSCSPFGDHSRVHSLECRLRVAVYEWK